MGMVNDDASSFDADIFEVLDDRGDTNSAIFIHLDYNIGVINTMGKEWKIMIRYEEKGEKNGGGR